MEGFADIGRTPSQHRLIACVDRWRYSHDRRAGIAAAFTLATNSVTAALRAGRFVDSAWVASLLDMWAEFFLVTADPADDDLTFVTSPPWADAHCAAAQHCIGPADVVLLGVNAHVTSDLPQAIACMLHQEWPLAGCSLERRRQDVDHMLALYGATIDDAQALLARFDVILSRERAVPNSHVRDTAVLMDGWTPLVWQDALALLTAPSQPWRDAIREDIECAAARRSHLIACSVAGGDGWLCLPSLELARHFPHRHETGMCRLRGTVPVWGDMAAATS